MEPLVSFVVPCYKLAHLLPECIQSILAQTYRNFEVLILDNCSPDNTPEVAASFRDPRVKHIRNDQNIGHVGNYNKGITLSQGQYVWWVSPDDSLQTPDTLARFVDTMERNPQVGYVFCRCLKIEGARDSGVAQWTDCGSDDAIWQGKTFLARLIEGNRIVQSAAMVRKACYDRFGLFRLDLPHACDWYLWCLLALNYDVAYLAEPMVRWRVHGESLTSALSRETGRICLGDEFAVLSKIGQDAERAGLPSLRAASRSALVHRAMDALGLVADDASAARLTATDLKELFDDRVQGFRERGRLLAQVCAAIAVEADRKYWKRDYRQAAELYKLAMQVDRWSLRTRAKYLLLKMSSLGHSVRRLSQHVPRPDRYA